MLASLAWKIKGAELTFARPLLMGILNLTPDSFSDGGRYFNLESAVNRALEMEAEGADLIDIGAESSRPGATELSAEAEAERLFPILREILTRVRTPISIDTTKSEIAAEALRLGVSIINDVSGLRADPKIASLVGQHQAGIVLMHRRGTPQTMQSLAHYQDLAGEVLRELAESIEVATQCGVMPEQIAVDPGLGFAKTAEQNFELIKSLPSFHCFSRPVVVGASRKSFLGQVTGRDPGNRTYSSTAISALLVERGAHVLRVHDVAATRDAISVAMEVMSS